MAKSLRSKWKRKMKAVKRERYGAKENDRLVDMLKKAGELPQDNSEIKMEEPEILETSVIEPLPLRKRKMTKRERIRSKMTAEGRKSRRDVDDDELDEEEEEDETEEMAVDKPEHVFSKRTMRDQFGNYPSWMNKRKMRTQQKKNKRIAKRRALSVSGKRAKK